MSPEKWPSKSVQTVHVKKESAATLLRLKLYATRFLDSCLPKRNVTLVHVSRALGASGLEYLRARSQIGCDQDGLKGLRNKMQTGFMTAICKNTYIIYKESQSYEYYE